MGLVSELKRRNVLRMAVLYVVAAWLIVQVAGVLIDLAQLPDWIGTTTLWLLAIGFPLALVFSWFYEITPGGISLEKDVDPEVSVTHVTGRRLDFIVIALLCAAVILFAYDKWWIGPPPEKSIAVLAFESMSGDPEQEYFSDGLSDTLIHVLAQVSGLKVTAKTSSFYFKGKNIDLGEIARELNVGTVLEGSVQKSGNRVRVIAQLVNAGDGTHLWSKRFDRDFNDIFAVQDEIAQEVVRALKVALLDTEEERLSQRYRPILQAYEQLILGRCDLGKRTAASLAAAEQHFKQAIALDPGYALAYVGLAESYGLQVTYAGLLLEESLQRRQPLIDKALELDPLCGEAYMARAYFRSAQQVVSPDKGFKDIEEDVLKGLELSPSSAQAHELYSAHLFVEGRFEEALLQARMVADLDPMSPYNHTAIAELTWILGRAEEALVLIRRNIERAPEFPSNYSLMRQLQTQIGQLGEAQRWIWEARRLNPVNPYYWMFECIGFMGLRDSLSAEECVRQLNEAHPDKLVTSSTWARLYSYRGEWNKAKATLESLAARTPGFREHDLWLADVVAGQGDIERARRLMANAYPEFLEDGFELPLRLMYGMEVNSIAAMVFAAILDANGETQRRDVLLRAVEERIATMHRTRGIGYGILDVYVHAMRDDRDQAIAGLREALDIGWRGGTLSSAIPLGREWKLANLHQDPEFIAMMHELETDIAEQRQWLEDHKDEPFF